MGREAAQPAQLVHTFGGDRLQAGRPRRVHRGRLAGQEGLRQHNRQQRVPEPGTFAPDHEDAGVDGLADLPGIRESEPAGDALQRSQVGRAPADCQDPGHLSRRLRHSSPGVQKGLTQRVGQVRWQLVRVEVTAPNQNSLKYGLPRDRS